MVIPVLAIFNSRREKASIAPNGFVVNRPIRCDNHLLLPQKWSLTMGLDVYSNLYAGVRMDEVYKKNSVKKEVTKYDENTGAPYKKTLIEEVHILGTKKFTEDEWQDFVEKHDYKPGELELFAIADTNLASWSCLPSLNVRMIRDCGILGVKIAGTDSHRMGKKQLVEVTQAMIDAAVAKAKKELAKFGIKDVKLFIVPHFSY